MDANELVYEFRRYDRRNAIRCVRLHGSEVLRVRRDLVDHSPDGPEWGFHGSGPAQAALMVLAHFTADDELAVRLHQDFKREVIAPRSEDRWDLSGTEVNAFLRGRGERGVMIHGGPD